LIARAPVLHLVLGPNGAGKSTLYERVIRPTTHLPFVNADVIAADRWPGEELEHAYEASRAAAEQRDALMAERASFATETVFSHPSKVDLVRAAVGAGYEVTLHLVMVPEDLAVARVGSRVRHGGHDVPEDKVRARWHRLWALAAPAIDIADDAFAYDNSRAADPFRLVATWQSGRLVSEALWPSWAPEALRTHGR
jgi:predicted ABC-type ATPase